MVATPGITCPRCGRTSYHPMDIAQGYCGHCHDWTSMIPLTIGQVASITGGTTDGADRSALVPGPVVTDTRKVVPGALFAALSGEHADGHDYAALAVGRGAVLVLGTRPVGVPAVLVPDVPAALARLARDRVDRLPGLTIAAITGSAGKTTAKDLATQLISALGPTVAPPDSYNNEIGHPLTVLRCDHHTSYLIAELGARAPGHIAALCQIAPPAYGVVLGVGSAHLGEFGTREQIALAKSELPAALPRHGTALLNADDPLVALMADCTEAEVVYFGQAAWADVRASEVTLDRLSRPRFTLTMPGGATRVALTLSGEHQVTNALAAAALARQLGMSADAIGAGLSAAVPRSKWRMEVSARSDGVLIVNDAYNSSPEAVAAALAAVKVMAADRRAYAVLGPMGELGERSRELHEEAGARAARAGLTGVIAVGDEALPILTGAMFEPGFTGELVAVPDDRSALTAITERLAPGDVVLVKASRVAGLQTVALALIAGSPALSDRR